MNHMIVLLISAGEDSTCAYIARGAISINTIVSPDFYCWGPNPAAEDPTRHVSIGSRATGPAPT